MFIYLGLPVQLCCGKGGKLQKKKYHWCVWGVLAVYGPHWVCPSSWLVCFPGLHCSGSRLLCWGTPKSRPWVLCTSQFQAAQVWVLGYSTKAQTQLGLYFFPFPGPSSSGDQVLRECTITGGQRILITSPIPAAWFPGCAVRALSQVCRVSSLGS